MWFYCQQLEARCSTSKVLHINWIIFIRPIFFIINNRFVWLILSLLFAEYFPAISIVSTYLVAVLSNCSQKSRNCCLMKLVDDTLMLCRDAGSISINSEAAETLIAMSDGDARCALNALEFIVNAKLASEHGSDNGCVISNGDVKNGLVRSHVVYDRLGMCSQHTVSKCVQKNVRKSHISFSPFISHFASFFHPFHSLSFCILLVQSYPCNGGVLGGKWPSLGASPWSQTFLAYTCLILSAHAILRWMFLGFMP